ncbi:carboxylesterase family protein [Ferruginibacter albus]|uniref:carboxylesterase family protein n=1 Tax=Ferruginibacter albus TaxID=2875540 RepID=UPI001CC7384B|nr:Ig-like domain-containing protein [Ferruginibacter albus]UAY51509.1 hypothetical protein K9M53_13045 [Ferruginibacter albus]
MKNKLRLAGIAMLLMCLFSTKIFAQVQTPRYNTSMTSQSNGYYEYLPQGYNTGSDKYPLLIFVHGIGELGDGSSSQLSKVLANGTPKQISQGIFPTSFTVGGQSFKFIVLSPQFINWPAPGDIENIINYAIQHYRVDQSRIYLTGLSMGGGVVWEYAGNNAGYANRVAAMVPISGASYPDVGRANIIAAANIAVWATHNNNDPTVASSNTTGYVNNINNAPIKPNPLAKMTIFNASVHDAWTQTYDFNFRENGLNVYEWMLQFKRSTSGGTTTTNQAPTVNAGGDIAITSPVNNAVVTGTASDDGSIAKYAWTQVSGPATATILTPATAATTISNLTTAGTYTFRLTVTDNAGLTKSDDVNITVNAAAANKAPVASAGADQTITLPTNSVTLKGSATDADGTIKTYAWTKVSGPSSGTIASPSAATTAINSLAAGTYTFRLTATDNSNATGYDDVVVTVNAAATTNKAPVANAGADQTITLPANSVTLKGSATDADGTIKTYAWTKVSGPSSGTIASPSAATTVINSLIAGVYTFRLTTTDNSNATGYDDIIVTVNAATTTTTAATGKKIRVNMYDANTPYNNSQWNNWNITTVLLNLVSNTFKYDDGTASTVKATLSSQARTGDNGAGYASTATVCPPEVLRFTSLHCIDRTVVIQGLKANAKYTFELYASRAFDGQGTIFKIGNASTTINTDYNATTEAKFTDVVADSKGTVTISIKSTVLWNYISGFTITEQ